MSRSPRQDGAIDEYQAGWDATLRLVREGRSWSGHERNKVFLNCPGGAFANVSSASGLDFTDDGRGIALVDWDHDGDLDLWLRNRTGPRLRLMLNRSSDRREGDFVAFRLRGTRVNRDAIGARVEVRLEDPSAGPLVRTLYAGEGFRAQSSKWLHFGLVPGSVVREVVVRWPGGDAESFGAVAAESRCELIQGSGKPVLRNAPLRAIALKAAPQPGAETSGVARVLLSRRFPAIPMTYRGFAENEPQAFPAPGRPLLVNLWASWCTPCVQELSELTDREEDLRQAGLDVLALSVEEVDELTQTGTLDAQRLLERLAFPFQRGLATTELLEKLELLQQTAFTRVFPFVVPQSFLLDSNGRVALIYRGPVKVDRLIEDLKLLELQGQSLRRAALPFAGRWYGEFEPVEEHLVDLATALGKSFPEDSVTLLKTALEHYERKESRAGLTGRQRRQVRSELVRIHFGLGRAFAETGRLAEAASHYRRLLSYEPDHAETHGNLGAAFLAMGDLDRAVQHSLRAVSLDSELARPHNNLALAFHLQGRLESALEHYRQSVALDPASEDTRYNYGMALTMAGQPAAAGDQFREVLQLNPDSLSALTELAWILATAPDPLLRQGEEALRHASRAAELSPGDATVLDTLAAAQAENGRFEEAIQSARSALDLARRDGDGVLAGYIQERLAQYRRRKPHREPAR